MHVKPFFPFCLFCQFATRQTNTKESAEIASEMIVDKEQRRLGLKQRSHSPINNAPSLNLLVDSATFAQNEQSCTIQFKADLYGTEHNRVISSGVKAEESVQPVLSHNCCCSEPHLSLLSSASIFIPTFDKIPALRHE